jgi:uncharacterized protein (UPF0261 family)
MSIAIVGMLDEREEALRVIKDRIEQRGHKALLIDISVGTGAIVPSLKADVSCGELLELADEKEEMPANRKNTVTSLMAEGLRIKILDLHKSGELQGIIAITGMTGALISLTAMKELPFGIPKLLVSGATAQPVHAGQFANYFAVRDITVMNTVVDTVGMNALVRTLAINGANAISGMVEGGRISLHEGKPSIAITEFGFCDKGAHYIREVLEKDFDLISFHATGLGDKAVMDLLPQGIFKAFIDLVPGAFSEHLLGGNRGFVGPDRLDVASTLPIPYIFCPGGFDIISCGPIERRDRNDPLWASRKLAERKLYVQDPPRVQARMSPEETEYVAAAAAEKLNQYHGKARVKVVIPLKGFSSISVEGAPLHDPAADTVFAVALKGRLDPSIEVIEVDADINNPRFARAVANALFHAMRADSAQGGSPQHE